MKTEEETIVSDLITIILNDIELYQEFYPHLITACNKTSDFTAYELFSVCELVDMQIDALSDDIVSCNSDKEMCNTLLSCWNKLTFIGKVGTCIEVLCSLSKSLNEKHTH